jgi:hypothetical protein
LLIIRPTKAPAKTSTSPIKNHSIPKDAEKIRKPIKDIPNNIDVPEFPGNLIPKNPIIKPISAYPQLNIITPYLY